MRFIGFIGPTYKLQSVNVDCQRCINLYPESNEVGSGKDREIASLVSTPGLRLLLNLGAGPIRGMYRTTTNAFYVVSSNKLYKVSSLWGSTEIATLSTTVSTVSMVDNGKRLAVVDGSENGYFVDLATDAVTSIPFPSDIDFVSFQGCDQVTYQDGFFIYKHKNSGVFFISGVLDSIVADDSTIDATDFKNSDGNPDNLVAVLSVHRDLWLFNEQTTEVFFNSGAADFPFERIQGAFIEHGCIAKDSVAKINNSVFWLGQDYSGSGIVYMANGYQPQRISTHAVEQAIQRYSDLSDATAYTYQENGHFFYILNFPSADTTWVFDTATSLWHERCYFNNGSFERHRANSHVYFNQTHVVGDYANGNIYALSSDVYTDNGAPLIRRRISPHVSNAGGRIFCSELQLDLEMGKGLDGVGQGTDPVAMLKVSTDQGHTWSNESWVSIGKIGETRKRAIWRRLGSGYDFVFDVSISDPVPVTIAGANLKSSAGVSNG